MYCVCIISCDGFKTAYINNYMERNADLVGRFQFLALVSLLDSIVQKWRECHRRFAREARSLNIVGASFADPLKPVREVNNGLLL